MKVKGISVKLRLENRLELGSWGWGDPLRPTAGPRSRLWLSHRMQSAGKALQELLLSAQRQGCLTAGVYESAKVLNV